MPKLVLKVIAHNKDGYTKVILDQTKEQIWRRDDRVEEVLGELGTFIDPKDFPEAIRFQIILREEGQ